jgi:cobalt-zinc-cadmium efflux system membrane fusion protein
MKRFSLLMICGFALLSCGKPKPASVSENTAEAIGQESATEQNEKTKNEASTVEMTPEAQQRSGVVVTPAAMIPMTQHLQVTGTVQPVDSGIAHIRPLARGRLQEVLAKIGDRVAAGQVLAQLDNIEVGEIAAQYNSARAELQKLRIQVAAQQRQAERNRRLAEIGAVPQKEYEFSLAEQQGLEEGVRAQESTIAGLSARLRRFGINETGGNATQTTAIRAPFAGVIIRMAAAAGDVVESGAELFTLADLSTVYVQAQVYEKDLGQVRIGQVASIIVDSYPGAPFAGRVVSIGDLIDPQTRTTAVRCQVDNSNRRLKLDMLATIQFPTSTKRATLSVPTDAVQTIEGKSVVFVRNSPARFSIRQVETGVTTEGRTEIIRGIGEGEPVVSKGAFAVKSVLLGKELGEEKE